MKYADNINALGHLPIDYMGMIFYERSARFVELVPSIDLPEHIRKVGVFVNAPKEYILEKTKEFDIHILQLHGNETPQFCSDLKESFTIIKAFSVAEAKDFEKVETYNDDCDYFLFDTKTSLYGGSGQKFDWSVLSAYTGSMPFFLSGGISEEDAEEIKKINHSSFIGIDLNSKFEIEAGLKDIPKLEKFINDIQL